MKMERTFASIRAYAREDHEGKTKSYATCDNSAVVEALFDSGDGVTGKIQGSMCKKCKDNCLPNISFTIQITFDNSFRIVDTKMGI